MHKGKYKSMKKHSFRFNGSSEEQTQNSGNSFLKDLALKVLHQKPSTNKSVNIQFCR